VVPRPALIVEPINDRGRHRVRYVGDFRDTRTGRQDVLLRNANAVISGRATLLAASERT
jgi:hypothetical protein